MSFDTLGLAEPLVRALSVAGYTEPTSVQAEAVPAALQGADLMVSSRTGSGKTASFVLPALMRVLALRESEPRPAPMPRPDGGPRAPRGPRGRPRGGDQ